MKKTEQFVITINRELGSGGRTVGEKLAERLGVEFYDKAVIKALTAEYHLTTQEIEKLKAIRATGGLISSGKLFLIMTPLRHNTIR